MAGHARYTALLDACALFPVAVCQGRHCLAARPRPSGWCETRFTIRCRTWQGSARVAEIIVELRDRVPVQVVRRVYFVPPFDDQGRVNIERHRKQQCALAAAVIDPLLAPRKDPEDLHDTADRFIAQGGRWRPTAELARLIDRVALGIAAKQWRHIQAAVSMLAHDMRTH